LAKENLSVSVPSVLVKQLSAIEVGVKKVHVVYAANNNFYGGASPLEPPWFLHLWVGLQQCKWSWDESSVVHCIPTDWIKLFILLIVDWTSLGWFRGRFMWVVLAC